MASVEVIRQMIEGKLGDKGPQASDVQVVIHRIAGSMSLHNKGGEFLVIPLEDPVVPSNANGLCIR